MTAFILEQSCNRLFTGSNIYFQKSFQTVIAMLKVPPVAPSFAQRLKQLMEERRPPLTQHELARMAGVSQAAVANWVNDRAKPYRKTTLVRLCHALGVCGDWLLYGKGPKYLPSRGASPESGRVQEVNPGYSLSEKIWFIEQAGTPEQVALAEAFIRTMRDQIRARALTRPPARVRQLAMIETDPDGRTIFVSTAFTKMCGYTFAQLKDNKPGDVLQRPEKTPEQAAIVRDFGAAIRERRPFECTLVNYHAKGTPYRVHIRMHPIFDDLGELVKFRAFAEQV